MSEPTLTNFNDSLYYQPSDELKLSANFYRTNIDGLFYFQSPKHNDGRGFFSEVVRFPELATVLGRKFRVKQVNHSRSAENVVRGMHAEGWNKLVTVISGLICSVIVDIRPDSPTYKQVAYFKLGFDHKTDCGTGLFISQGLANSVAVLKGPASYIYLVDKLYEERDPKDDQALDIFDEALNIQWPIAKDKIVLSQRDVEAVRLEKLQK